MATKRAIVIGSGAGGSMVARAHRALGQVQGHIFEKGANYFENLSHPDVAQVRRDSATTSSSSARAAGSTRIRSSIRAASAPPRASSVSSSARSTRLPQTVGGGLNHADWKARRFTRSDFRLADVRPAAGYDISGSSVENWPIGYDDLEKFYTAVEYVAAYRGRARRSSRRRGSALLAAQRAVPDAAGVPQYVALKLATRCDHARACSPLAAPMGITSQIYPGAAACNDCGFDGGFGCPINAKAAPP
jgi:gluconate 2-dehydrogenase alpha chain